MSDWQEREEGQHRQRLQRCVYSPGNTHGRPASQELEEASEPPEGTESADLLGSYVWPPREVTIPWFKPWDCGDLLWWPQDPDAP